jgi:hypothetical protein
MPRLRPHQREEPEQNTLSLEQMWVRCTQTHAGIGGYLERGIRVKLEHPNVRQHPDWFELSGPIPDWIVERISG